MDIQSTFESTVKELLDALSLDYSKIVVKEIPGEESSYRINIDSEDPSLLIGYHGENLLALQHILKVLIWKKLDRSDFSLVLDVDEYRKRQEENVLSLAERKVEIARNTNTDQKLPPMSPYFRRIVHMYLTQPGFDDITTESIGTEDRRQVIIKVK